MPSPSDPFFQSSTLKRAYRVVMRTSVGCEPPVKGCTLTSSLPFSREKPMSSATCLQESEGEENRERERERERERK